jgi:carboxyl-terminal processing protease
VRAALDAMTLEYPLAGLIIDNRQNTGGRGTVLYDVLALFTSGIQGTFVSRTERHLFDIEPEDRGGSQSVPLVVLVAPETMSYGEVMSGVLHDSGRATVIGQTSQGNVETIKIFNYPNGSRAWIAHDTFQYPSEEPGLWEKTGIIPDIDAPSRWDLFSEANDPALAAAVEVLK